MRDKRTELRIKKFSQNKHHKIGWDEIEDEPKLQSRYNNALKVAEARSYIFSEDFRNRNWFCNYDRIRES